MLQYMFGVCLFGSGVVENQSSSGVVKMRGRKRAAICGLVCNVVVDNEFPSDVIVSVENDVPRWANRAWVEIQRIRTESLYRTVQPCIDGRINNGKARDNENIPILLMGYVDGLRHFVSFHDIHYNQRLSVVGVCDSKSMVVAPDVYSSELDDEFLLQVCEMKSSGFSLGTLSDHGLIFINCSASSNTIPLLRKLEIYSRYYSDQPLVMQGAGAGHDTTVAGVLADIIDMQDIFVNL